MMRIERARHQRRVWMQLQCSRMRRRGKHLHPWTLEVL